MSESPQNTCLTVLDLAARFRVSKFTIYAWIQQGKLPPCLPFTKRWDRDDFERWLEQQKGVQRAEAK
jgi:excisionase family DNA binding protein